MSGHPAATHLRLLNLAPLLR